MKELVLYRENWYVDMMTIDKYKDDNSAQWVQDKLAKAGFDMEKDIDYVDSGTEITYTQKENGDVNAWKELTKEQLDAFGEWAIGQDIREVKPEFIPGMWNLYHGDKLQIDEGDDVHEALDKMLALWRIEK